MMMMMNRMMNNKIKLIKSNNLIDDDDDEVQRNIVYMYLHVLFFVVYLRFLVLCTSFDRFSDLFFTDTSPHSKISEKQEKIRITRK